MPWIDVDGDRYHYFPGTNPNVTVEQVREQIRQVERQIAAGDYELVRRESALDAVDLADDFVTF